MYLVTAREMQTMDRLTIEAYGIPGQVLMENAGRAVASSIALAAAPASSALGSSGREKDRENSVMARHLNREPGP